MAPLKRKGDYEAIRLGTSALHGCKAMAPLKQLFAAFLISENVALHGCKAMAPLKLITPLNGDNTKVSPWLQSHGSIET